MIEMKAFEPYTFQYSELGIAAFDPAGGDSGQSIGMLWRVIETGANVLSVQGSADVYLKRGPFF